MTKKEFMKDFGENLAIMMRDANTSLIQLSEYTGLSTMTINYYLHGKRMPSLDHLINISRALCCNIEDLVDLTKTIK